MYVVGRKRDFAWLLAPGTSANVDASACANLDAGAPNYPSASWHPGSSTASGAYASAQACVSLGVGS